MSVDNIFTKAKHLAYMDACLDSALVADTVQARNLSDQVTAVQEEIIARLVGETTEYFGELEDLIQVIVTHIQQNDVLPDDVSVLSQFISSKRDVEDVLHAMKKHGFTWIPERLLKTAKYVALVTPIMLAVFEPARLMFITLYLSQELPHILPIAVALYLTVIATLSRQEVKLLNQEHPFVINPYVSILAIKLKPILASIFVRAPRVIADLSIGTVALLTSKQLLDTKKELMTPILLFIVIWNVLEMAGNASLARLDE